MCDQLTPGGFDEIHDQYRDRILHYLQRLTRQPVLAEDLTQETLLRASRALESFRGEAKLSTWLYRIATNVFLDHRRQQSSRPAQAAECGQPREDLRDAASLSLAGPKLPDRLLEDSEMGRCVREFIDRLPADYRAVVVLHDLEGLTSREIAEVLECSPGAVKIRIHRARQSLRALLGRDCDLYYDERDVLRCDRRQPGDPCGS